MSAPAASQRVCTVGLWHLGSVVSACLAELGHQVTGVDPDAGRIERLGRGIPPLFEPGLEELLKTHVASRRLAFTTDLAQGVRDADAVLLTFDTPVDANDELDLSPVTETINAVAPLLRPNALLIIQSQIPVGTCAALQAAIQQRNPRWTPGLACVPENLRLGQAISRLLAPAMLVIGADDAATLERADQLLAKVDTRHRMKVNLKTAEMTKHALNAFFATCVSFANELGVLCDEIGADGFRIAEAMRLDERIGPKALVFPGAAFGGGTLARDVKVLQGLGRAHGGSTPLIDAILTVNERQKQLVQSRLTRLFGTLKGLEIGVLGLTYKAGTSTLRRSPALELINSLMDEGARLRAYDPKADREELGSVRFRVCCSPQEAAEGVDALIIATEWPEFKALDFAALRSRVRRPLILDTKNLLEPAAMKRAGFQYLGIGRGITEGNGA